MQRRLTVPARDLLDRSAAWYEAEVRAHMRTGEVWVDDALTGVAVWTGPDTPRPGFLVSLPTLLPSLRYYRWRSLRGLRVLSALERVHPRTPSHRYLAFLGTDPDAQGTGVGSALVRAELRRCDERGLGAHLESSNDDNISWYARFGFRPGAAVGPKGGPLLTPMWRDPREPTEPA